MPLNFSGSKVDAADETEHVFGNYTVRIVGAKLKFLEGN